MLWTGTLWSAGDSHRGHLWHNYMEMAEDMNRYLEGIQRHAYFCIESERRAGKLYPYFAAGLTLLVVVGISWSFSITHFQEATCLIVICSALAVLTFHKGQSCFDIDRVLEAMRQELRSNLLDNCLLGLVLEFDAPLRLPSLTVATATVPGAPRVVAQENSLRGRLETLTRRYPQCCKESGLPGWNTRSMLHRDADGALAVMPSRLQRILLRSAVALEVVAALTK